MMDFGENNPFEFSLDGDTQLEAAAREAGWALSTLVDSIAWAKRSQVEKTIGKLAVELLKPMDGVK